MIGKIHDKRNKEISVCKIFLPLIILVPSDMQLMSTMIVRIGQMEKRLQLYNQEVVEKVILSSVCSFTLYVKAYLVCNMFKEICFNHSHR